eukprot:TRINITY_DN34971_c0_g1_i1.p1 TRINITY_DN34971_c0_g1~~TRINITY_DN34971_c0_g1_i1.p1  ORF type:complete len:185 (+),score=39.31 TRINITY_DN34971_c0_g1_i1:172-726(+)
MTQFSKKQTTFVDKSIFDPFLDIFNHDLDTKGTTVRVAIPPLIEALEDQNVKEFHKIHQKYDKAEQAWEELEAARARDEKAQDTSQEKGGKVGDIMAMRVAHRKTALQSSGYELCENSLQDALDKFRIERCLFLLQHLCTYLIARSHEETKNAEFAKKNDKTISEIGRAVQQECRDRSRMPSSA